MCIENYEFSEIRIAHDIRNNIDDIPQNSGVYRIYVDQQGVQLLEGIKLEMPPNNWRPFDNNVQIGMIYIGEGKSLMKYLLIILKCNL